MAMEVLLIRIDTFRDRKQYLSILKAWLVELAIANGRLITMGEFHLLFIAAEEAQITKLLEFYATREIDTNSKDELCVDKFIDIVGRKRVEGSGCKGFLEMNILNKGLLEKVLVHEWHGDQEWLDSALATPRTKALLAWREEAKASRRDRRKKSAQERDALKQLKKQQAEAEAAAKAAAAALKEEEDSEEEEAGAKQQGSEESEAHEPKEDQEEGEKVQQQSSNEDDDGDSEIVQSATAKSARPQRNQRNQQTKKTPPQGPAKQKQQHGQNQKQGQRQDKKRRNSQDWKQKSKQQKRTNGSI